jgi:alkylation response protein AidB-like acyl-CoA dehydrogenase
MLEIARDWAGEREQWGQPIGKHDTIAQKLAWMASHTMAMEAIVWLTSGLADRGDVDLRIEAAMAKLWNTEMSWKMIDELVQIRGGRGFETAQSLAARGEKPYPVERIMRDMRINRIFEGTSEIQHLFIAREAVDPHMKRAGALIDPRAPMGQKMPAFAKATAHYATWYPTLYAGWSRFPRFGQFGKLSKHIGYVERASRHLARSIFHAMTRYQAKLERKQAVLNRIVDIGVDLFAMTATISYATALAKKGGEHENAIELADVFCGFTRERIEQNFRTLFSNNDDQNYKAAMKFLKGDYTWLEGEMVESNMGVLPTPEAIERAMQDLSGARR